MEGAVEFKNIICGKCKNEFISYKSEINKEGSNEKIKAYLKICFACLSTIEEGTFVDIELEY